MKYPLILLASLIVMIQPVTASQETMYEAEDGIPMLSADELDELLGPVALYPDALVALILPACTVPTDIVRAARFLNTNPDTSQISQMPWDESVIALCHYPAIIRELNDNLEWVIMVGQAFALQSADVMRSIQRLRSRADGLGHLSDTAEQQIVREGEVIRIIPADPEVIYVPYYQTRVVYRDRWVGYGVPTVGFRYHYPVSSWLYFDFDWVGWNVAVVHPTWRHSWYVNRPWRSPYYRHRDPYWKSDRFRVWAPPRRDYRGSSRYYRPYRPSVGNYRRYDPSRPVYRSSPRPPSYRPTPRPPRGRVITPPNFGRTGESSRYNRSSWQRLDRSDRRPPDARFDRDSRDRSGRDASWRERDSNRRDTRNPDWNRSRSGDTRPEIGRSTPPTRPERSRVGSSTGRVQQPARPSAPPARESIRESRPQPPSQTTPSSSRRTEGDGPRRAHDR